MRVRLWLFTGRQGDYPEGGTYDTSVFDSDTKQCSDPHQEVQFQRLMEYAQARGEVLQQVATAAEAFSYCSPKQVSPPATVTAPKPIQCQRPLANGQIALSTFNDVCPAGWEPVDMRNGIVDKTPTNVMPSLTPPPMGQTQSDSQGDLRVMQGTVYRLILETAPGRVDTGATYPLCTRSNPDACKPIQFANIQDAINYAAANGETPVSVSSAEEAWAIIEGSQPIDAQSIIPIGGAGFSLSNLTPLEWGAIALGAAMVLPAVFKRKAG